MEEINQKEEEDHPRAVEDSDNANEDTQYGVEETGEEEEDASENEEEEEEEENDTVDEDDQFIFGAGVNPLDFVRNNDSGVNLYQKFKDYHQKSIEYRALDNRKRKLPLQPHREETSSKKAGEDDIFGVNPAEVEEFINFGEGKRPRKRSKKRGRQKGSKKKLDEKISQMLGDAHVHYANGRHKMAISVLHEVVRLEPNLPDSYHTLGLVHGAIGDHENEMGFYMITAHLTPKDPTLWKTLYVWSIGQDDIGQASYCISKAIKADPQDSSLRSHQAMLYAESQNYQKAAEAYEQVYQLCRENVDALKAAAKYYQKCGQVERSICILEDYLKNKPDGVNASVVDLLGAILMEIKAHDRALQYIEQSQVVGKELPLNLKVKAGICHVHLGNLEMAQVFFNDLKPENASKHVESITEVADSFMGLGHYNSALNYFKMLEGNSKNEDGLLYLKIARCYQALGERKQAIISFYIVLETLQDDVEARITLASLLVEEGKENEAISLLSPPKDSGTDSGEAHSEKPNRWWIDVRIKLKLCNIFQIRGMLTDFVDVCFPLVRESLNVATPKRKGKLLLPGKSKKKRLSTSDLLKRVEKLAAPETDSVFRGFKAVATSSDRLKASRAKKALEEKAIEKEKRKAEAAASGIDWRSDDSDDELQKPNTESPLCNLHKDEGYHQLLIDLCNALASLQMYREALEIINLSLKLAHISLSAEKNEKLRSLGVQMAYSTPDPKQGFDCVKGIVKQHAQSVAAWNCYYKVISRLENRDTRHDKFLRDMQEKYVDSVPPILISAHQFTLCSHHQDAARKYLEAYKLLPKNPLVNLCVGTALINLALGFRLQNKHQCVVQGLAFLYNNLEICKNSQESTELIDCPALQESLYNIARAYHHVGLVTLAAIYYEKVIAIKERDYPIPKFENENIDVNENHKPGYCDLRREAAYNLHLIYKKSGALDLARQVLKDYCSV
ncbi:general transcription factor 3C polypeptide 3 isoform X3 [Medicago truncatula]|uniref:general transcription factor 3C polypeptide 3 isoform X3 n=1 Tax=Medicago truncatula TaxID=3880 RepID=UPI0019671582|nr:general transcription factor 3C polypeptide 3 isoform X3 [Medicago truncatula]